MEHRIYSISRHAAAALLLLLIGSCSSFNSNIRLYDSAGLSAKDRDAVTAHARSEEVFYAATHGQEVECGGVPWRKRVLNLRIEGSGNRINVSGLYQIGDIYRGGPRFKGVKTKDGWIFSPSPINPC
jgi:hypothetical protein